MAAAGNSQEEVRYSGEDRFPLPKAYYRLKTVDLDGSVQYSDIVLLERASADILLSRMYPNPARGNVQTEWYSDDGGQVQWEIRAANGQLMVSGLQQLEAGRTQASLPLQGLPAGLYFVQFKDDEWLQTRKLFVE